MNKQDSIRIQLICIFNEMNGSYIKVSTGAGKAAKRADFGKWTGKAGKTYTFRCPEAGKKYTLDIKLA